MWLALLQCVRLASRYDTRKLELKSNGGHRTLQSAFYTKRDIQGKGGLRRRAKEAVGSEASKKETGGNGKVSRRRLRVAAGGTVNWVPWDEVPGCDVAWVKVEAGGGNGSGGTTCA
ncbi:hypothetical protein BDV93DRAFT_515341 [Ceratobasidium sp. AG-I]|nr:hypothetical protein BDV93DRAFT_515341 [Ceratobasidium sp. AG-I]